LKRYFSIDFIATDLFPATCLNPHLAKEFRGTRVPIMLEKQSASDQRLAGFEPH
jgi:hypothetical protein